MKVLAKELEIRGKEKKVSKKGTEYIIARVEDETGKSYELYDSNVENFEFYKRGQNANFILDVTTYDRKWNVTVVSFEYVE